MALFFSGMSKPRKLSFLQSSSKSFSMCRFLNKPVRLSSDWKLLYKVFYCQGTSTLARWKIFVSHIAPKLGRGFSQTGRYEWLLAKFRSKDLPWAKLKSEKKKKLSENQPPEFLFSCLHSTAFQVSLVFLSFRCPMTL